MGMVGFRGDLFVVPAASFHHNSAADPSILSDTNGGGATALGVGVGVIPLLTAAPLNMGAEEEALNNNRRISTGIQLWQQNQHHSQHSNYMAGAGGGIASGGASASSSSTATCQDCGNQAKKDCSHRRCRTCCKSRGFDCATHVKSTWVPAARRRERQLMAGATATAGTSSGSTSGAKKPRLITSQTTTTSHTSTSNTPPRSYDTSSSHQDASFKETLPGQVRAPAVFKCVRVTAVDDGEDEYAYQAVVKIGGHVFKGFLYDQGLDDPDQRDAGGSNSFPNISELHLGGGGGRNVSATAASSSPNILDPSDVYAAGAGGLLGVSTYGNQIN